MLKEMMITNQFLEIVCYRSFFSSWMIFPSLDQLSVVSSPLTSNQNTSLHDVKTTTTTARMAINNIKGKLLRLIDVRL